MFQSLVVAASHRWERCLTHFLFISPSPWLSVCVSLRLLLLLCFVLHLHFGEFNIVIGNPTLLGDLLPQPILQMVLFPVLFGLFQSEFLVCVDHYPLIVSEQHTDAPLQVIESPYEEDDVQLFFHLFLGVFILLHWLTVLQAAAATALKYLIERVTNERKEVEFVRVNGLFLCINEQLIADAYVIADFVVHSHNEDKTDDSSNQTTHIGEISINFVERTTNPCSLRWFFDIDLCKETVRSRIIRKCFEWLRNSGNFFCRDLLVRE